MRKCSKCASTKPETEYYKRSCYKDNTYPICKGCCNETNKAYGKSPKGQAYYKKRKLRQYGMLPEEYDIRYNQQQGCCSICNKHKKTLTVDHNHTSNKVRGLICAQCNLMIGNADDSINTLKNAIEYLVLND